MFEIFIKIHGRVQGVGFRHYVRKQARLLGGISGWVRNAEDGSVEVWMRGDKQKLEELIAFCRQGPSWARVDGLTFKPAPSNYFLPPIKDGVFEQI